MKALRRIALLVAIIFGMTAVSAQSSLPAPGSGGSYNPGGGISGPPNGIGWNPGPPPPSAWGNPWNSGWNYSPTIVINNPAYSNQGVTKVIACGYDAMGVWRVLPLTVSYQFNGVDYDVNVLNAWNPWTDTWDRGVDLPAYNTSYILRGTTYDFYVVLPTGTFYFNL